MSFSLVTPQVTLARNAGALYNYGLGNELMASLASSNDINGLLNSIYTSSVGSAATSTVASTLVANLGITGPGVAAAQAYVVAQLNPVAVSGRGKAINDILMAFSSLTDDATYGAAAKAWNAKVANAVAYAAMAGSKDTTFAEAVPPTSEAPSFKLTASSAEVNEGGTAVFTLSTKGVPAGSVFNYVLNGATGADVTGGSVTGSATVGSDGKALIGFSFANDATTEGDEKFTLSVAGQTADVTVKDTSLSPSVPIALTVSTDSAVGTDQADAFTAPSIQAANTFTALDNLDGKAGVDTLAVSYTGAFVMPGGIKVANIEQVAISSNAGVTLDTSSNFSGMTNLTVTGSGAVTVTTGSTVDAFVVNSTPAGQQTTVDGGKAVTVNVQGSLAAGDAINIGATSAPKGAVSVSLGASIAGAAASAPVTVKGGATVEVNNTIANSTTAGNATGGAITVTGTADTTSVSVIQSNSAGSSAAQAVAVIAAAVANVTDAVTAVGGLAPSTVTINDAKAAAGTGSTIKAVTLKNYGTTTITTGALESLTLSAGGKDNQNLDIASGALTVTDNSPAPTGKVLALNLGGGRLGNITANTYETINANMAVNTRIGTLADTQLKTLNIDGTGQLRAGGVPATLTAINLKSATAAFRGDISGTAMLSFDGTISTAVNNVTVNAAVQTFTGGSGDDKATTSVVPTKILDGGAGTDTFSFGGSASGLTTTTAPNVKNFEIYEAAAAAGVGTTKMSNFTNSTFAKIVSASNSGTNTFTDVKAGTPLTISTASTSLANVATNTTTSGTHVYQTSDFTGAAGSVTVTLAGVAPNTAGSSGTAGSTHTALTLQDATGSVGIGTVNFVSDASVTGGFHTITTLTDPNMFALNISGTGGVVITNHTNTGGSLAIKDTHSGTGASSITTLTAANLASLSYDGTANYNIGTIAGNTATTVTISNTNLSTASGLLTIGGLVNGTATTVFLNGAVALTGTFAAATKVVGPTNNANNTITAGGAAGATVTLGNGTNIVTGGVGPDTITLGTGASSVTGLAGGDTITFGAGHTGSASIVYTAAAETAQGTVANGTTIVSAAAGYDVVSGLRGGDTINLTALGQTFSTTIGTAIATTPNESVNMIRGNWNNLTGYFTASSTGADTLVQWDSNPVLATDTTESIVLVGFANVASSVTAGGVITLG